MTAGKIQKCLFSGLVIFQDNISKSQNIWLTHFSLVCIQKPKWLHLSFTRPWCFGANIQRIHCTTEKHTYTHSKGNKQLHYTNTKRFKNKFLHCGSICFQCDARSPQRWHRGDRKVRSKVTTVHLVSETGMDTYLTRSADLCKHTSGSRLYCPLTSAELLIVKVTQL